MAVACLLVHEVSVPYIKNVLFAIFVGLREAFDQNCRMVTCSTIDSAEIEDAEFIFVVGENLKPFKRLPGRFYIYLNFSVVAMLGSPFQCSINGVKLIRYKNQLLRRKLDLFDALLDYYPPQTRHLAQTLKLPVAGFVPWVPTSVVSERLSLCDRPYDVCFVGGLSRRRLKVVEALRAAGCNISPSSGVDAEDVASQSKCTLNIHMQRSNHLEIPRVMGALSVSPLITEESFGVHELLPSGLIQAVPYKTLVAQTLSSLDDTAAMEESYELARSWYYDIGEQRFMNLFISSVKELQLLICRRKN